MRDRAFRMSHKHFDTIDCARNVPNPRQAQGCHLRSLQVGNGLDSVVVGEFQHGCLGVKFGGRALGDK
jgi:hypothetical protein